MNSYAADELEEFLGLGWGDATVYGWRWCKGTPHLLLRIEHASRPLVVWLCYWASDLMVNVCYRSDPDAPKQSGPLLTWSVTSEDSGDKRMHLHLDFASKGEMSFRCDRIETLGADENLPEVFLAGYLDR